MDVQDNKWQRIESIFIPLLTKEGLGEVKL